MEILRHVNTGIDLLEESIRIFKSEKKSNKQFLQPFIVFMDKKKRISHKTIGEMTEESICSALQQIPTKIATFVLAGETVLENPKTKAEQYFFVAKLYFEDAPQGYVYSIPFSYADGSVEYEQLKYAGSDNNCYLKHCEPEGEGSSCNVIKMDPNPPYEYRAAFLIGHVDEKRLWNDTDKLVADMICKLALETEKHYELIFEVSKFGHMTTTMQEQFDVFDAFVKTEIFPKYSHIKAEMQLENKRI